MTVTGLKHRIKVIARELYARVVWHSGLHRLFDRVSGPRVLVLYGHCVADDALNATLAGDMKIDGGHLRSILRALGGRYDLVTVGEGIERLRSGAAARSMVALSMDDGYRDNLLRLVPLLEECGARATVFLEAGAVVDRRLPWLHGLSWLGARLGAQKLAALLAERIPSAAELLREARDENRIKRVLKYDADTRERDEALHALLDSEGAERTAIVDALYLSPEEAQNLQDTRLVEVGGHTVSHPVLARGDFETQTVEIKGGRERLEGLLGSNAAGATFAYPYGRPWDWNEDSKRAAKSAGYSAAVTTIAGVNTAATDFFELKRWPIHTGTRLHLLGTEASGAFQWLRRLGIELVQS